MTIIDNLFALEVDRRLREKRTIVEPVLIAIPIPPRPRLPMPDTGDERHVGFIAARSTHRTTKGHR